MELFHDYICNKTNFTLSSLPVFVYLCAVTKGSLVYCCYSVIHIGPGTQHIKYFLLNLGVITIVFYETKADSANNFLSKRFEKSLKNADVGIQGLKIEFRNLMEYIKKKLLPT